jgi:hypothetical protein
MQTTQEQAESEYVREIRKLQLTPEERRRLYGPLKPFDADAWMAAGPPATPEELAETEELLQLREEERQASLAREAGILPWIAERLLRQLRTRTRYRSFSIAIQSEDLDTRAF